MEEDKKIYKNALISAIIGGIIFAIPYVLLDVSIILSLVIATVVFFFINFHLSNNTEKDFPEQNNNNLFNTIYIAKKQNAEIYQMINKIEDKKLVANIKEIYETASKIIDTIAKNPSKLEKVNNFFDYYLPVTLKILKRYDDIENQKLESKESKEIMRSTEDIMEKINQSFKMQLSQLYQSDIIDTDAEIKVFEQMLKSDGFGNLDDFNIK